MLLHTGAETEKIGHEKNTQVKQEQQQQRFNVFCEQKQNFHQNK